MTYNVSSGTINTTIPKLQLAKVGVIFLRQCTGTIVYSYTHILAAVTCSKELLFRLQRPIITCKWHKSELRLSVGDAGRQVLRSCRSTSLWPRRQCRRGRRNQRWGDIVQSEREITLSAQSQVYAAVSTVSRRTRQLCTTTCPQRHRGPTRFANNMFRCVSWFTTLLPCLCYICFEPLIVCYGGHLHGVQNWITFAAAIRRWFGAAGQEFMENECEALPGVAYPGVRDNRRTINTKTGYDDDDGRQWNWVDADIESTEGWEIAICPVGYFNLSHPVHNTCIREGV